MFTPPLAATPEETALTDEQLLGRCIESRDRGSFEILVRRYQHEIYNYLRRYLDDDSLAEDAFQLTFMRVFEKAEQFDLSRRFRPWLYGVATNQAIDLKRRLARRKHTSLDVPSSEGTSRSTQAGAIEDFRQSDLDPVVEAEFREKMRRAVEEVGEPGRSALELVYLQGMAYRDAAEVLGIPVGTVKSRVHSAIRKLADVWQRNES